MSRAVIVVLQRNIDAPTPLQCGLSLIQVHPDFNIAKSRVVSDF